MNCGEPLKAAAPAGMPGDSGAGRARGMRKDPEGLRIMREMGRSPKYLTAVIAYTASVALTIIGSTMAASSFMGRLSGLLRMADTDGSLYELESLLNQYSGMMRGAGFMSALIGSIPAILITVSLWLIYMNCKKEPGEEFSTTGFTILHVLTTIGFVAIIIGVVIYVIAAIGGIGAVSRFSDGGAAGFALVAFLLVGVFIAIPLIYCMKLRKMLGSSKRMAAGGPIEQTASMFVGVLVMLQALSALGSLVTAPGILKLQAIAAGVASICFGMLIFSFRDRCANPGFVEDAVKAEDVPLDTGKASSENGSFSEYAPFYEDSYAPAGEKRDAGYNSGEWTGYEPEKIQPVQGAVAASSQGLGVPDPYNTIVEPDPRFDPRFFQGNSEDTIVESYPGEFNSAGFANNAGYFNNINNKDVSGNAFGSETWIAYPEQPSEPAKPAAPVQNQRNESAFSQERLFSAAQDIQNGPSKDPFGDREKPVFSVQEQQFNGPEAAPQGNMRAAFGGDMLNSFDKAAAEQQERLAREKAEQERIARERAEQERLAREKAEQERLAREKAEQERIAREKAEQERLAREKAEQERLAREKAEQERLAREKAEQERIAREKAEQERLAREKAEQERLAQEKAEQERIAREKAEQERLAREKAEQERIAREKAEQERLAQEKAEQERLAREKAEQERLAWEKAEQERLAREKAEQERLAREKAEQERIAREKAEQERLAREKAEQERIAREKAEQERLAQEKAEQERLARQRAERERLAREREMQLRQNFPAGRTPVYETTTLSTSPLKQPSALLLRHRDQSHVTIKNTLLRIGRNMSDVDYWVRGNPAIGRHHADIIFREGDYYIIDRNSTNHVYINGQMIAPGEEVLLPNPCVIRLADEEFTFQVKRI